jgi:hypothetical protein
MSLTLSSLVSAQGRKSFAHYGTLGRHKHDHRERTGTIKPGDVK